MLRMLTPIVVVMAVTMATATGCNRNKTAMPGSYKTVASDPRRDTDTARRCNATAVGFIKEGNLADAQKQLELALEADVFFGPAHNNMGNVYYKQKKFYLAAWEFQYAAKLMPTKAEPKNNLGLVFEQVGKMDDAAKYYEEALALEPDNTDVIGNLARVYVRENRKDEKTRMLLMDLIMKDDRPEWKAWAEERLKLMGKPEVAHPALEN